MIRSGMLARYTLGVDPIPATTSCETSDQVSGVAQPSYVIDGMAVSEEPGTYTFTCSGAFDRAGNGAGPATFTYSIVVSGT